MQRYIENPPLDQLKRLHCSYANSRLLIPDNLRAYAQAGAPGPDHCLLNNSGLAQRPAEPVPAESLSP